MKNLFLRDPVMKELDNMVDSMSPEGMDPDDFAWRVLDEVIHADRNLKYMLENE
jgi:hypothetical protein